MERASNIRYNLETRAGYRVLQWDLDWRQPGRAWPRESFFWQLLIQLRSVSRLLYTEYPCYEVPSAEVTRLEELLRARGIEYQEMLPKGIQLLWYRLGLAGHTGLRIGGVPIADEELLERLLFQGFADLHLGMEMYAVDAPVTPWFRLFEKTRELQETRDLLDVLTSTGQPFAGYLELLNECVCAMYFMDQQYVYEMHTVRLSDDQMLAMFTEAARRSGYSIS